MSYRALHTAAASTPADADSRMTHETASRR